MSEYEGVDLDTDYEEMVVGYIVGACDRTMKNALFTIDEIRASGVNSNVLIADSKDERDASRCMPIELKKGTDVREEANLVDNPEVLGRRIGLLGLVKTYFKVVGLKNVAYHEWLTNGGDVEEPEPEPEAEQPGELPGTMPPPASLLGKTQVTVDEITPPHALMAGKVLFKSGAQGAWDIDRTGRINWDVTLGEPTADDLREFETELQSVIRSRMGAM